MSLQKMNSDISSYIINTLYQYSILDEALMNLDDSWGETIADWDTHFEILSTGGCFDDWKIKRNILKNPVCFIIWYLFDYHTVDGQRIATKDLYETYCKWCEKK